MRSGRRASETSVGAEAATSHETKEIWKPIVFPISAPSGLPAIAVSQSAEERLRVAMAQNMR